MPNRRRPLVLVPAAVLAVAGVVGGSWLLGRGGDEESVAEVPQQVLDDLALDAVRAPIVGERFYFLLTDRFENGDPGNDTGGIVGGRAEHGHEPTDIGYYHGGDLAGVRERLDYLQGLGVTAVWLTPVMVNQPVQGEGEEASAAYHGYWVTDFTDVDPHLGDRAELEALVAEAHERDMVVVVDVITNHTADVIDYAEGEYSYRPLSQEPYTPVFRDPGDATVKAPQWLNDTNNFHNRGNSTFAGESSLYGDFFGLDDIATGNPAVVEGFIEVYQDWIDLGVDGFRIDTVKHVDLEFWQQWAPAVMEHARSVGREDFFMFGEVYETSPIVTSVFSTVGELPTTLDFGFQSAAAEYVNGGSARVLSRLYAGDDYYTDADSNAASLPTFLGNHDMGRAAMFYGSAQVLHRDLPARVELGHSLMFLTRGQPVVYYGDEQGFTSRRGDKEARQSMFATQVQAWVDEEDIYGEPRGGGERFDDKAPLYRHIAELSALQERHPALASGAQLPRLAEDGSGVFAVSRILAQEGVEHLVLVNNSVEPREVSVRTGTPHSDWVAIFGESAPVSSDGDGRLRVRVPAVGALVLQAQDALPETREPVAMTVTGGELRGRAEIRADLEPGPGPAPFAQVTFAVRPAGGGDRDWTVLGTDDAPPYRVYPDASALPEGDLEVLAVARPWGGPPSAAVATATVPPAPTAAVTGTPAPGQPALVVATGTFQAALGCPADWDPACTLTGLVYDEDGQDWSVELDLPGGEHEFKIALEGSWEENYGAAGVADGENIPVRGGQRVRLVYDHGTHEIVLTPRE